VADGDFVGQCRIATWPHALKAAALALAPRVWGKAIAAAVPYEIR